MKINFSKFLLFILFFALVFNSSLIAKPSKKKKKDKAESYIVLNGFKYKMKYKSGGNFIARLEKGQKIPSGKNVARDLKIYITGDGDLVF